MDKLKCSVEDKEGVLYCCGENIDFYFLYLMLDIFQTAFVIYLFIYATMICYWHCLFYLYDIKKRLR